jgi:hypothetical protein
MASKKNTAKRGVVSVKDVQIAFLLDGISGVDKLLANRKTAGNLVRRALKDLQGQGKNVGVLEAYANEKHPMQGRGRAMPTSGEERKYRAQQVGSTGVFLRLPLTPIGIKKGGLVKVRFESDRLVITRA